MIKKELSNRFKSQICLGLALLLIGLNFISSFIYYGFFQPQRGHFLDALQKPNSYDKYKPKVNIEKSSDTTTAELF